MIDKNYKKKKRTVLAYNWIDIQNSDVMESFCVHHLESAYQN
jgi:hypothetical protein